MKLTGESGAWVVLLAITLASVAPASVADPEAKGNSAQSPKVPQPRSTIDRAEYPDVPRGHWAAGGVDALSRKGLIEGHPDGGYHGNQALTRYEFAVALARDHGPDFHEMAPMVEVRKILERLTVLENRFKTLEDKLNAAHTPAGLTSVPPTRTSQITDLTIENELQSLHSDFKTVTKETSDLAMSVNIGDVPSTTASQ